MRLRKESSNPGDVCWSIRVARINQCSQMEKRDQRDPNLFQHLSPLLLLDICEHFSPEHVAICLLSLLSEQCSLLI